MHGAETHTCYIKLARLVRSNEWVSGSAWIYLYSQWQKVGSMEPMEPWLNPPLCIHPKQVYTCSYMFSWYMLLLLYIYYTLIPFLVILHFFDFGTVIYTLLSF